jgi:phosphatidylserine synthase
MDDENRQDRFRSLVQFFGKGRPTIMDGPSQMNGRFELPKRIAAMLVYARPPLVFGGLLCAIAVMWTRSYILYTIGVVLLCTSMTFDVVDGWFSARYHPNMALAHLADRIMDKVVYSIIFPLVAVGVMWRLVFITPNYSRAELLHAILVLILCVTVLVRDNFAHFMRGFAIRQGQEPEVSELNRLRTVVAAPVGAILYAYAFYIPEEASSRIYGLISGLDNIPLRVRFIIEIIFLVINLGSIASYCRKYGTYCLDELCLGEESLRRKILTFFPNALTIMNALMGLLAVFFAYQGRIREAYLILLGAAIFDKLDGALARKLGLTEASDPQKSTKRIHLGSILDDIADAISFCIVPGWIFYICFSNAPDPAFAGLPIGWIAFLFAVLGIVRLIYFTLDKKPIPGFFKGLPTPAAALWVVAPLVMFDQAGDGLAGGVRFWGQVAFGTMIAASLLMNAYPIRYIHYGRFMNRHPLFVSFNVLIGFVFLFTPFFGHFALFCLSLYILSPTMTWRIAPEIACRETRLPKTEE